jgi:hypothetical protein
LPCQFGDLPCVLGFLCYSFSPLSLRRRLLHHGSGLKPLRHIDAARHDEDEGCACYGCQGDCLPAALGSFQVLDGVHKVLALLVVHDLAALFVL